MRPRVGDLVEIQAGYQFRGKVEPEAGGNIALLQIKDIERRRRITPETIDRVDFERSFEPYLICRGDVLFLSRGHRQFAVAVEQDLPNTIASGYFYILRLSVEGVRPAYLAWYINQPPFQTALAPFSQGTHMPFVSQAAFQDLAVPVPPLAIQDAIVALADLAEHEQDLLLELATKRAALVQALALAASEDAIARTRVASTQDASI